MGLVAAGLVPFGFNLVVGHGYGAASLGEVSIALGLALFLGQIPGTFSSAATKFIAEASGRQDAEAAFSAFQLLLALTLTTSLVLGLAVLAVAPVLSSHLHISPATLVLAAAIIPTYSLYLFFKSVYYAVQRVRTYLWNEIVSDLAFYGVLAGVALTSQTPWLLLPFVLNNAIFAAIALRHLRPYLATWHPTSGPERSRIVRYCLLNGSGTAASLGRWSLGVTICGLFVTHHQVGLFAAAIALTAPLPLLPRAISLVTFALMARLHGQGERGSVQLLLRESTEWLVFVLGIPSGLVILNAGWVLTVLFRSSFAPAALTAALIIAGAYLTDISRPSIDALSSTEFVRIPAMASYAGLVVSLVMWLTLIPRSGIVMAGLGFAVGAVVTSAIPAYYAWRHIGSDPGVFIRPGITVAALALLWPAAQAWPVVASVVFVFFICLLYRRLLVELLSLISNLLRPVRASTRDAPASSLGK